jgi:hypothetical protein
MCWEMDQAKKRISNSHAFLDFWTLVANGIGWVRKLVKVRKGRAILKLLQTFALVANGIGGLGNGSN